MLRYDGLSESRGIPFKGTALDSFPRFFSLGPVASGSRASRLAFVVNGARRGSLGAPFGPETAGFAAPALNPSRVPGKGDVGYSLFAGNGLEGSRWRLVSAVEPPEPPR